MSRIGIQLQFLLYSVSAYLSPYSLENILPIPTGMRARAREGLSVCDDKESAWLVICLRMYAAFHINIQF